MGLRKIEKPKGETSKHLQDVCSVIRKALHLDHLEQRYTIIDEDTSHASSWIYNDGWRLNIKMYNSFWEQEGEQQARDLIHEHIHVALHPYHQAFTTIRDGWVAPHNSKQVEEIDTKAGEMAVDHLTSALFDLLEPQLKKI